MITNRWFKNKYPELITIILVEKRKAMADYGHDDYEVGFKDDSERTEWEEYYKIRNKKMMVEDSDDDE